MLFQVVLRGCAQLQVLDGVLACHVRPGHWVKIAHLQGFTHHACTDYKLQCLLDFVQVIKPSEPRLPAARCIRQGTQRSGLTLLGVLPQWVTLLDVSPHWVCKGEARLAEVLLERALLVGQA